MRIEIRTNLFSFSKKSKFLHLSYFYYKMYSYLSINKSIALFSSLFFFSASFFLYCFEEGSYYLSIVSLQRTCCSLGKPHVMIICLSLLSTEIFTGEWFLLFLWLYITLLCHNSFSQFSLNEHCWQFFFIILMLQAIALVWFMYLYICSI